MTRIHKTATLASLAGFACMAVLVGLIFVAAAAN